MRSTQRLFLLSLITAFFDFGICRAEEDSLPPSQPEVVLRSGLKIPLVGFGIGNLPHESIPQVVDDQLRAGARLIDTAYASNNEQILADAISKFDASGEGGGGTDEELEPLHVVTKVWYTHLGYKRTRLSIQESLNNLQVTSNRPIHVHMLLHWPRCDDEIPWMNCEEEENNLPQLVKDIGPPPHLDKADAFLESWRAMEDVYLDHSQKFTRLGKLRRGQSDVRQPFVSSIGVSNFGLEDMKKLVDGGSHVPPQIYQGNSWLVFHDPFLMDFLEEHRIFFQAFNVMNGIVQKTNDAPAANQVLTDLSRELAAEAYYKDKEYTPMISEATVVLAYFIRSNFGVIPRAASPSHQQENSSKAVSAILPHLTDYHIKQLETAIPALMKGEDAHTSVSFMNALETSIQIHWVHPKTNEEFLVSNIINPGSVEKQKSHQGHIFVAYDPDRTVRKEFVVDSPYGEDQFFMVEL